MTQTLYALYNKHEKRFWGHDRPATWNNLPVLRAFITKQNSRARANHKRDMTDWEIVECELRPVTTHPHRRNGND